MKIIGARGSDDLTVDRLRKIAINEAALKAMSHTCGCMKGKKKMRRYTRSLISPIPRWSSRNVRERGIRIATATITMMDNRAKDAGGNSCRKSQMMR